MRIDNRNLRRKFSGRGCCAHCGQWSPVRHCAHVFAIGMGGNNRLDVPCNLVSLCWLCHRRSHEGDEPTQETLLRIVAKREGTTPDAIREEIYRLRRLSKETTPAQAGYAPHRHPTGQVADALQSDPLAGEGFSVATHKTGW